MISHDPAKAEQRKLTAVEDSHQLTKEEFEQLGIVERTIAERGQVYGDPRQSHTNIGLAWTGLLQHHYGITLDHPIPPEIVALLLVQLKVSRSARVFKTDNYTDLHAYAQFAEEFQKQKQEKK